jgi:hypothetical protein
MSDDNDLLIKVTEFFTPSKFMLLYPIIMGEDVITMSTINYVVTNYAKDFSSYITVNGKNIYIYKSNKKKLSIYTKKKFDAFCRQTKFPFYYNGKDSVVTTVGQLNYYQWCLEIDLLTFIRKNYDDILINMKRKALKSSSTEPMSSASISMTDSELTASEKTRYKNKIIVSKVIKLGFNCT